MATDTTEIVGALSPVLEARGLDLVDVEVHGAELTVFVDRDGGVGLDELGDATRDVSAPLEARARAAPAHAGALREGGRGDGDPARQRGDG